MRKRRTVWECVDCGHGFTHLLDLQMHKCMRSNLSAQGQGEAATRIPEEGWAILRDAIEACMFVGRKEK